MQYRLLTQGCILGLLLLVAACDSVQIAKTVAVHMYEGVTAKRAKETGHYKIGKPYRVGGRWYYPQEEPDYVEEGMASWYGDEFHNKTTANGETFHKGDMTAAHRTLPLPSIVRVTNMKNGKTVSLRVNDRGPFKRDRILDVSEHAARELGFHSTGTAKVRVEFDQQATFAMLKKEGHSIPARMMERNIQVASVNLGEHASGGNVATDEWHDSVQHRSIPGENLFIQTGAYSSKDAAMAVAGRVNGKVKARVQEVVFPERTLYRVRVGPVDEVRKADDLLIKLAKMGFSDAIIVKD